MNLKNGKVFTSKFVGTGPSSCEKRIYWAAVSQRLRNTDLEELSQDIQSVLLRSMRLTRRHIQLVFFICYQYLPALNFASLNSVLHSYFIQNVHYDKESQNSRAMTLSPSYSRYCTSVLMENLTTFTENLRKNI